MAGSYVWAKTARPSASAFALANEFSDHVMERQNYLYLAHSKLRPASIRPRDPHRARISPTFAPCRGSAETAR